MKQDRKSEKDPNKHGQLMETGLSFEHMVLDQLDIHMEKYQYRSLPCTTYKTQINVDHLPEMYICERISLRKVFLILSWRV